MKAAQTTSVLINCPHCSGILSNSELGGGLEGLAYIFFLLPYTISKIVIMTIKKSLKVN